MSIDRRNTTLEVIAEMANVPVDSLRSETELVGDLGFDSSRALELVILLEDKLEITVPDHVLQQLNTVGDVLTCVKGLKPDETSS